MIQARHIIGWLLILILLFIGIPWAAQHASLEVLRRWAIIATMLLPVMFLLGWLFRHKAGNHNG